MIVSIMIDISSYVDDTDRGDTSWNSNRIQSCTFKENVITLEEFV